MKSNLEKESILNSYKLFLKTCDFDIQILIQSKKEDLSSHLKNIKKNIEKENNENLEKISNNYFEFIKNLNEETKSSSKNFYIIVNYIPENFQKENENNLEKNAEKELNEKYLKIKECLSRCGNQVFDINKKKQIEEILFTFYNLKNNFYFNKM